MPPLDKISVKIDSTKPSSLKTTSPKVIDSLPPQPVNISTGKAMPVFGLEEVPSNPSDVIKKSFDSKSGAPSISSFSGDSCPANIDFAKNKTIIEQTIGLPPSLYQEIEENPGLLESLTLASMPVLALTPAYPTIGNVASEGVNLYGLDYVKGKEKYNEILRSAEIKNEIRDRLYVAFLNDSSISESFSLEFGESKFESIANFPSQTLTELRYIAGEDAASKAIKTLSSNLEDKGGMINGGVGKLMWAGGAMLGGAEKLIEGISNTAFKNILSGSKVDFPAVWKGSSYSPSYSVTIRLYNPNSQSKESYEKYIIEPLIKLLAFTIPISDSAATFSFPVLCSAMAPGLFRVDAGYVSSIDVMKGGDSNNISYEQNPGTIDIKLTINELYNTMISGSDDVQGSDKFRPTLKKYAEVLRKKTEVENKQLTWGGIGKSLSSGEQTKFTSSVVNLITASTGGTSIPGTTGSASNALRISPSLNSTFNSVKIDEVEAPDEKIPISLKDRLIYSSSSVLNKSKQIRKSISEDKNKIVTPVKNQYAILKNKQTQLSGGIISVQDEINNYLSMKKDVENSNSKQQDETTRQKDYLKNLKKITN